MGFPIPELPDGLHDSLRKLIATCQTLCKWRKPGGVKTRRLVEAVWKKDPSRSSIELYADLLRQSQNWIARYPLFGTQGNFGSIDGDPPAPMAYNEVRPSSWALLGPALPQVLANGGFG